MLNDYSFKHDFLEDEKPAAEGWLEGYLFPDTYEVYKGNAAVVDTINKMLNNFGNKYDADIKSGAENLGRSMHDIVTIPLSLSVRHSVTMSAHVLRALSTTV